ncbi:hypothetical protein evm_015407 [Chilo suppressalis]|nr:hypothetical protein evm_015407 [Chilo suppressalis]
MNTIIATGITCSSAVFILAGMCLLFGNLAYQEGFVQAFVWVTFVNVLVGYLLIVMVGFECVALEGCLIGHMDWLSSAAFLVAIFFYLTCEYLLFDNKNYSSYWLGVLADFRPFQFVFD